jgi:tagaturonate reductase
LNHYKQNNSAPEYTALGFAAFIRFMQVKGGTQGQYTGTANNEIYKVTDNQAQYFSKVWENADINTAIQNVLKNKELWDADLSILPGFKDAVIEQFNRISANGSLDLSTI